MKEKKINCGFCEILCDKNEVNLLYQPCEVYEEKLKSNEQNGE